MSNKTVSQSVILGNEVGLHIRPANQFAKLSGQFESEIAICNSGRRVDGKSILDIISLGAEQGTELKIETSGSDAEAALEALVKLVESDFAEDETVDQGQVS